LVGRKTLHDVAVRELQINTTAKLSGIISGFSHFVPMASCEREVTDTVWKAQLIRSYWTASGTLVYGTS
jgi:hypothetical protein